MVRHKNRYFLIEVNQENKSNDSQLLLLPSSIFKAVLDAIGELHGDFGLAAIKAGFIAKYCNELTRIAIIRVRHGPHKIVASSLPFVNCIDERKASIRTLYIGATIKQCLKFLIAHQRRKFEEACLKLETEEEKLALKEEILNIDRAMEIG